MKRYSNRKITAFIISIVMILQICLTIYAENAGTGYQENVAESNETEIMVPKELQEEAENEKITEDITEDSEVNEIQDAESEDTEVQEEGAEAENPEIQEENVETQTEDSENADISETEEDEPKLANAGIMLSSDTEMEYLEIREISPYEGIGELGIVSPGDFITYEISYCNISDKSIDMEIFAVLDRNTNFISADQQGEYVANRPAIVWNLGKVPAKAQGILTFCVEVSEYALGKEVSCHAYFDLADADAEFAWDIYSNSVSNMVWDGEMKELFQKELSPDEGIGVRRPVSIGSSVIYQISFKNDLPETANVIITDKLDENVYFVHGYAEREDFKFYDLDYNEETNEITCMIPELPSGYKGYMILTVEVQESALDAGYIRNTAFVKVGDQEPEATNEIINPVMKQPYIREVVPYEGSEDLGKVYQGDQITYEISYSSLSMKAEDIEIMTTVDWNTKFISADNGGTYDERTKEITWHFDKVPEDTEGCVRFTVEVLETAYEAGRVSQQAQIKIGKSDWEHTVYIENRVGIHLQKPWLKETYPYGDDCEVGTVGVAETLRYDIAFENHSSETSDIIVKAVLDENVLFESAQNFNIEAEMSGWNYDKENHTIVWTLKQVPAGEDGIAIFSVSVKSTAKEAGSVSNVVYVQMEDGTIEESNVVTNPVVSPVKLREVEPYEGDGILGQVSKGDMITYEISYQNYMDTAEKVYVYAEYSENAVFKSTDFDGKYEVYDNEEYDTYDDEHTDGIRWELGEVPAHGEGSIRFELEVCDDDYEKEYVYCNASVRVADDTWISTDIIRNPLRIENGGSNTNPEDGQTPEPTQIPEPTQAPEQTQIPEPTQIPQTAAPDTGDNTPILFYAGLMAVSALLAAELQKRRKKKMNR